MIDFPRQATDPSIGSRYPEVASTTMSASQTRRDRRGRWLSVLFWTGVALALPAVLSLLLGQGESSLRLAAVLVILCVVFIGLSIALRGDAGAFRVQVESLVLDEIDALREENRENIVAVARKLHSTLQEDAADLADEIQELRDQLSTGGSSARTSQDNTLALSRGLVHADSTAQWRQTTAASGGAGSRGNGAGASATASAAVARSVSGLPRRSGPVYSSPTSPSPVSPGPVAATPTMPTAGWHYPNGGAPGAPNGGVYPNSTTYSSGGYPPDTGYQTGRGNPNVGNPSNGNIYQGGNRSVGRRRAPEPEAPRVAIESGHRTTDPWADLRDDTGGRSY